VVACGRNALVLNGLLPILAAPVCTLSGLRAILPGVTTRATLLFGRYCKRASPLLGGTLGTCYPGTGTWYQKLLLYLYQVKVPVLVLVPVPDTVRT
jgi:hypothetical protein